MEENLALMEQALKEVNNLTMTLLAKEFSSENLESIFKARSVCAVQECLFKALQFLALGTLDSVGRRPGAN